MKSYWRGERRETTQKFVTTTVQIKFTCLLNVLRLHFVIVTKRNTYPIIAVVNTGIITENLVSL